MAILAKQGRIDDIEILRAVAIIITVYAHFGASLLVWGDPTYKFLLQYIDYWAGVDLFFVISGFVIARDLLKRLEATTDHGEFWRITFAFWIRRAYRILPSAWLWLIIMLVGTAFFNRNLAWGNFRDNFVDAVAILTQVANIHFYNCTVLKEGVCGNGGVYWSLSLEEQFYILLPIAFLAFRARFKVFLFGLVLFQIFLFRQHTLWGYIRSDALALGVLLAIASRGQIYQLTEPVILRSKFAGIASSLVLILLLMAMSSDITRIVPFIAGMVALLCAALVYIASYNQSYILPIPVLRPVLIWIGTRSYAIYLIHIPVFFFTRELWFRLTGEGPYFSPAYFWPFTLTALPLILILAELNFRWLEVPFRNRGKLIAQHFVEHKEA